ncbi:MAG: HAMP domain-containing protein [Timaviella obliquedivisa GSE-PSE-MK23-08B]|jgi:class 3 adenylate cyclase/HAMP domain-containing protein|nr:HAMP domain-containing protein [Timaviella obliquedivisa GSE-PSE-MK23-08B]
MNVRPGLPLRAVVILPFVLQILTAVGLVGYLSFRNGQRAVNDLSTQLRSEVADRIHLYISNFVALPPRINKTSEEVIRRNFLTLKSLNQVEQYIALQMRLHPTVSYIAYGNSEGKLRGGERKSDGALTLDHSDDITKADYRTYQTDADGDRTQLLETLPEKYDARQRPWYKAAANAGKPIWGNTYLWVNTQELSIPAVHPIYSPDGKLQGVFSTEFLLSNVSKFLQKLKIAKSGKTFVIERSGLLIASSISEKPFRLAFNGKTQERLNVYDSKDALTHAIAKYLLNRFGNYRNIRERQQLEFDFNGDRQLMQIQPFSDGKGLDWLIVVVIPEADFMEQIYENTRSTLWLCLAAATIATVSGIYTSRWITQPILQLSHASRAIAEGDLEQKVMMTRTDELGVLAQSFNQMAVQLKISFEVLEVRVEERTAELNEQRQETERLLLRLLPASIADRLKRSSEIIADSYTEVTVLFADLVDFTAYAHQTSANDTVGLLNQIFSIFDQLAEEYQLEKIKTIGDGYMIAGGLPIPKANHAEAVAEMAIAMQRAVAQFRQPSGEPFQLRVGIHTGAVIAGVIGKKKFTYDLWGDTVNLASRMESRGLPGKIQVSPATYQRLQTQYSLEERGIIEVKGFGAMQTYWLNANLTNGDLKHKL